MTDRKVILLILDGWGYREEHENNGVYLSNPINFNKLFANDPHTLIDASEEFVGLPVGQMGNSEVGHTNIGAGRVVYQDLLRVTNDIISGNASKNTEINKFFDRAKTSSNRVHFMGLLSDGGVHSHIDHFKGMIKLAKDSGVEEVYVHIFTDGRDTPPTSGIKFVKELNDYLNEISFGKIATIIGRYYAMDRDKRWDRVERAWNALHKAEADRYYDDPLTAMEKSEEGDEFVLPTVINGVDGKIKDNDSVFMMNFRADRVRELLQVMSADNFDGFQRDKKLNLNILTLTEYDRSLHGLIIAYPPEDLNDTLGEVISNLGLKQLRIAETEKYAHVTYFLNGGREDKFPNEIRELIASPRDVATYDLKPEMSVHEVGERFEEVFSKGDISLAVMNFANPDMVGHTGVFEAILKACKSVDEELGRVIKIADKMNAVLLVTADHGNSEYTWDYENNEPHTAHTLNKVPFIVHNYDCALRESGGKLADIAPTILEIMGIEKPSSMSGVSLIKK